MKKRILLIDDSLTVQKVVALTLDRARFQVLYAKSRAEAMRLIVDHLPSLILVSDQVADVQVATFPREVETLLARRVSPPPVVLITSESGKEMRHYAGVLVKPFSPQALQDLVLEHTGDSSAPQLSAAAPVEEFEDQNLQKIFNNAFSDEAKLVRETFEAPAVVSRPLEKPLPESREDLWQQPEPESSAAKKSPVLGASDSLAYKAFLENKVQEELEQGKLDEVVERVVDRLLPSIVERLVQERLDRLLAEQEKFLELKT